MDEKEKELFELVTGIVGDSKKFEYNGMNIERISDLTAVDFMKDYSCKKDNIWFSIMKINGQEKYLYFDYSREHDSIEVCTIEDAIKMFK